MNYIIFDLEATCWLGRPPKGVQEIIEIGAYKLDDYGEVIGEFKGFVRPTVNPRLSGFCKKLTSISQEDVNRAGHFKDVIEPFMDWIEVYDEPYVLCSWGAMDRTMLLNDCRLHKLEEEWLDYFVNLKNQYYKFYDLKNPDSLKKALRREGLEFEGTQHRAIWDAHNLARIFKIHIDSWVI